MEYQCQVCKGTEVEKQVGFIKTLNLVRETVVCARKKCVNLIDYKDTKLKCECGNAEDFTTKKVDLMGDGKEEHFANYAVVCSKDDSCSKVLAYVSY